MPSFRSRLRRATVLIISTAVVTVVPMAGTQPAAAAPDAGLRRKLNSVLSDNRVEKVGTGAVVLETDATENTHLFWTTAAGALDAAERGEIALIFPTRRNLERLAEFSSFEEARDQAKAIPVKTITPWMEERDGERWLMIADDAGYPVAGEPLTSVARG